MALSSAQIFRRRINDLHRREVEVPSGDGLSSAFQLIGFPIASGTAQSLAGSATVLSPYAATTATWDFTYGVMALNGVPSAESAVGTAVYYHSVFSDEEVNDVLSRNGDNQDLSQLEVLRTLMSDAQRRAKWSSVDGVAYDESMVMKNLKIQYDTLLGWVRMGDPTDPGDGPIAWSETQGDYI